MVLEITMKFKIVADVDDEDEVKEEVTYALQDMLDNEEIEFSVEEAEEETDAHDFD